MKRSRWNSVSQKLSETLLCWRFRPCGMKRERETQSCRPEVVVTRRPWPLIFSGFAASEVYDRGSNGTITAKSTYRMCGLPYYKLLVVIRLSVSKLIPSDHPPLALAGWARRGQDDVWFCASTVPGMLRKMAHARSIMSIQSTSYTRFIHRTPCIHCTHTAP